MNRDEATDLCALLFRLDPKGYYHQEIVTRLRARYGITFTSFWKLLDDLIDTGRMKMNCDFDLKLHNAIDETLFSQWHVLQPALATYLSGDKEAARAMWLRKLDELAKGCRKLLDGEGEDE
ncbi:MAG: hypothetical protein LBU11_12520 [Zoogloeaceae bacterium]|jgi:hypothetical protein|nr:hypothetical protein [Zoogloeaceae bacterium]